MKRKDLKGKWEEAVKQYENSWAPDILGWWFSRYCLGEILDLDLVLEDVREECPLIAAIELEPYFEVILKIESGKVRIRFRSRKTKRIGYTYWLER